MDLYDFSAPAPSRPVAPALREALEQAAPRMGLLVEAMLRRPATATAGTVERLPLAGLELAGQCRFILEYDGGAGGGRGGAALLPQGLVVGLAEMFMGGPGRAGSREPSPLEQGVVASRLGVALGPLAEALPVGGFRLRPAGDIDPLHAPEIVLVEIVLAVDGLRGSLRIALPGGLFSAGDVQPVRVEPAAELVAALRAVPLPIAVRFDDVRLPGADLERLAVGDVVRLAHPVDRPLVAEVDGRPLFLARPGRRGRRLAVEVTDLVEGSPA